MTALRSILHYPSFHTRAYERDFASRGISFPWCILGSLMVAFMPPSHSMGRIINCSMVGATTGDGCLLNSYQPRPNCNRSFILLVGVFGMFALPEQPSGLHT